MKIKLLKILLTLILVATVQLACGQNLHWTHFRGSDLSGVVKDGSYPVEWNDSTIVKWMTPIEGRGWSSPVVYNNQLWLSSASPDGKEMYAICIDRLTGKQLLKILLFTPEKIFRKHAINSYATPTPAIEDGFVYFHFGRYGTACLSTLNGEIVWKREDFQCEHIQGPGSSLLIHRDKLIVHMEGTDVQDIYALSKRSGKTLWKAKRDSLLYSGLLDIGKKAYVTPIVIEVDGRELLISNGSAVCNAYDVETGEEVWYIIQGEDSTISMPVEYNSKIYFYTSFVTPAEGDKYCELWCVDPRGKGDLSTSILWRVKFPILQLLTPVISDNLLYTIDTESVLYCIDAETGEIIWQEKLKGKYNSSPIVADGKVYVNNTRGETLIFSEGTSFEQLALNTLDGEIWSTPAFVDGIIYMRTSKGIFAIGE